MKLYYLDENYEPQGMLKGISVYIADLMVREQVEQGNLPCVDVFERDYTSSYSDGGFDWDDACFSNGWEHLSVTGYVNAFIVGDLTETIQIDGECYTKLKELTNGATGIYQSSNGNKIVKSFSKMRKVYAEVPKKANEF